MALLIKLTLFGLPIRNGVALPKNREKLTNPLCLLKTPGLYKATNVKYAVLTGEGVLTANDGHRFRDIAGYKIGMGDRQRRLTVVATKNIEIYF